MSAIIPIYTRCHLCFSARRDGETHLDDDQITDADPETLDRNRSVETPRRPSFPKSQPGDLIETSLRFLITLDRDRDRSSRSDRPGKRDVAHVSVICLVFVAPTLDLVDSSRSQGGLFSRRIRSERAKRRRRLVGRSSYLTSAEGEEVEPKGGACAGKDAGKEGGNEAH